MSKTRLNLSLDRDLVDFVKTFAAENRTSVADVVAQYLLSLRRRVQGDVAETFLANPAFQAAMHDARVRLTDGTAERHTFNEVFID